MTDSEKKRAFFVEVRRGLGIILRASVVFFGVGYSDLLPAEVTVTPAPAFAEPATTPAVGYHP